MQSRAVEMASAAPCDVKQNTLSDKRCKDAKEVNVNASYCTSHVYASRRTTFGTIVSNFLAARNSH